MKKVLLATTILGMTAGFAAAEIAFTGEATAGFAQNGNENGGVAAGGNSDTDAIAGKADNAMSSYSSFKLSVAATAESDSGVAFGASTSFTRGNTYTLADDKGFNTNAGAMGNPTVFVSGDFGKLSFKQDGYKEFQDDSNEFYDVDYAHSIAGITIGVRTDLDGAAGSALTTGKSSIKLGYTTGPVALSAAYDEVRSAVGVSAVYTAGALAFTLEARDSDVATYERQRVKVAYAADGLSASLSLDTNDVYVIGAGYSANGLTVGAEFEADNVAATSDKWKLTGSYDLGGGLTAEAGVNYTNDAFVGAKMAF